MFQQTQNSVIFHCVMETMLSIIAKLCAGPVFLQLSVRWLVIIIAVDNVIGLFTVRKSAGADRKYNF